MPKTVEEALALDKENGNDLWWKAIQKEMSAVKVAFKILDQDEKPPVGSQYMKCHMVFSIKMEDFSQKACLVAGGHMVEDTKHLTYASMVSGESVRIALTLAALNDLEVKTSDIQNAYLTAPCSEKVHTTLETEFGETKGRQQSLLELYIWFGSIWCRLQEPPCRLHAPPWLQILFGNPDLWYKPEVRQQDKFKYYSYVLLYVDDYLCIHHLAEEKLNNIDKLFKMKAASIGDPDIFLGAKVKPMKMNNGVTAWAISLSRYVNEPINNCEKCIQEKMPQHNHGCRASNPFPTDYDPDLDTTAELDEEQATYYQSQISILH